MSCPICGHVCRCANSRASIPHEMILADDDPYDPSEEQFAASVMSNLRPQNNQEEQEFASGSMCAARERYATLQTDTISAPDSGSSIDLTDEHVWRREVASRLEKYKARRRRDLGDSNLSFNFESTAGNHVFLRPEHEPEPLAESAPASTESNPYFAHSLATAPALEHAAISIVEEAVAESCVTHAPEPEPEPAPPPPPPMPKLIVFPRPTIAIEPPPGLLAEPVPDTPRILDAPESVETVAIPLADIDLHPETDEDDFVPDSHLDELPRPVAPVASRVFAEVLDTILVVIASAIFDVVASRLGAAVIAEDRRTFLGLAVMVPAMFWSLYKYIFFVHAGRTLGMQVTRLRLLRFDGSAPKRITRRWRALAMLVSIFPLGLGLFWSCIDPDTLCWHDRISRTYMVTE